MSAQHATVEEVPEYEIITPTGAFFDPDLLPQGTKVRTWAPPGNHLRPLNAAAEAAMEAWYDEDHPAADKDGRALFLADGSPKLYKPHAIYRIRPSTKTTNAAVEVLERGTQESKPIMGLAQIMAGTDRRNTDQRPPALQHSRPTPTPNTDAKIATPEEPMAPTAQVIAAAPEQAKPYRSPRP